MPKKKTTKIGKPATSSIDPTTPKASKYCPFSFKPVPGRRWILLSLTIKKSAASSNSVPVDAAAFGRQTGWQINSLDQASPGFCGRTRSSAPSATSRPRPSLIPPATLRPLPLPVRRAPPGGRPFCLRPLSANRNRPLRPSPFRIAGTAH